MVSEYQTVYHRPDCTVHTTCIAVPHNLLYKLIVAQRVSTLPSYHGTPRLMADSEELTFVPVRSPHSHILFP
jgi:hypothetical protein